jgi:hypothetical protein
MYAEGASLGKSALCGAAPESLELAISLGFLSIARVTARLLQSADRSIIYMLI